MFVTKAKLLEKERVAVRKVGADSPKTGSVTQEPNPQELLHSLREKYHQFVELREQGLIHQDTHHLSIEAKLKTTIADLENLIPQLEEKEI